VFEKYTGERMRKALKRIAMVFGGLVGLIIVVVLGLIIYGQASFWAYLQSVPAATPKK
jgi:hypothetical protein